MVAELERERAMRLFVFPKLQSSGKLTAAEAAQRLERLDAVLNLLNLLRDMGIHRQDDLPLRITPHLPFNKVQESASTASIIKGGE